MLAPSNKIWVGNNPSVSYVATTLMRVSRCSASKAGALRISCNNAVKVSQVADNVRAGKAHQETAINLSLYRAARTTSVEASGGVFKQAPDFSPKHGVGRRR